MSDTTGLRTVAGLRSMNDPFPSGAQGAVPTVPNTAGILPAASSSLGGLAPLPGQASTLTTPTAGGVQPSPAAPQVFPPTAPPKPVAGTPVMVVDSPAWSNPGPSLGVVGS